MSRQGLEIRRRKDGDVLILHLAGAMDSASVGTLRSALAPLIEAQGARVLLDCTDLSYVNSMAMGQFAALNRACEASGGRMAVSSVYPSIMEVMKLLKLDKMLAIYSTQAEALAALKK